MFFSSSATVWVKGRMLVGACGDVGDCDISLVTHSLFFKCSLVSLEQDRERWERPRLWGGSICLHGDLCTHNASTVPGRWSYFSLTLIIEMRHLAQ